MGFLSVAGLGWLLLSYCTGVCGFTRNPYTYDFGFRRTAESSRSSTVRLPLVALASSDADSARYQVSFEYCTGCKWGLRSFWLAQELLMTFEDDPWLVAVTLIPSRAKPGGVFRIKCHTAATEEVALWDRKENGGFPKAKILKQLVREQLASAYVLGHGDTVDRQQAGASSEQEADNKVKATTSESTTVETLSLYHQISPSVIITYCRESHWLLRAAYYAQELASTFADEINSLTLVPSRPPNKAGIFTATLDSHLIWDRSTEGDFPEITELKQRARDRLDPEKDLGHSDNKPAAVVADELDDDDAAEARKFFGVF